MIKSTIKNDPIDSKSSEKVSNGFKPYDLNGYKIIKPFSNLNAGSCEWTFCTKKNGSLEEEFFIKKFMAPKYPKEDAPIERSIKEKNIKYCLEWEKNKRKLYNKIKSCANGNIVIPIDFFRSENFYYLVTDKIDSLSITLQEISKRSFEQKQIALKVLAHCVAMLSFAGIVHADLKATNILFKETFKDYFTVKLIDFDTSFLQDDPPQPGSLGLTPEYAAPESFIYENEYEYIKPTVKADVFSLGILFHEILSGEKPKIVQPYLLGSENYCNYICEAVLDDEVKIEFNVNILPEYKMLIKNMLKKDVHERFSIINVMDELNKIKNKNPPKDIFDEPIMKNKKYKEKDADNKDSERKGIMAGGKVVTGTGWSTLNDSDLG